MTQYFASVSKCSIVPGCLLGYLGFLLAMKQNSPMCFVVAAVAAVVIAKNSRKLFSGKSLSRCKLPHRTANNHGVVDPVHDVLTEFPQSTSKIQTT